jgi:GNAT superfamily N-acetyltransferase
MSTSVSEFAIVPAESAKQIAHVRQLFLEYAKSLGFSLCFQNFDKELADLPGTYAPPDGRILLAEQNGNVAGCIALHRIEDKSFKNKKSICEMKRLYVRRAYRGKGLGRTLAERLISEARSIGYHRMRLDTVEPIMKNAVKLYLNLGFREISPYCENPIPGAMYLELIL